MKKYNTPMNGFYNFTPELAFNEIKQHWKSWDAQVKPKYYVIGISGGIDSSCVAALGCKIFSKDRIIGVSLPCDGQKDMDDVNKVFNHLGIKRITIDIGGMFFEGLQKLENNAINITNQCKTNMPARLRMTMLYGVAQCVDGIVLNTCQRSETICGNDTLFGDDCGSYAPIQKLTKTEVKAIAAWLGVPNELVNKTPIDGLQPLSDEERLGITYTKIDDYIRSTGPITDDEKSKICKMCKKNLFKMKIIHIDGPDFGHYPDTVHSEYGI